MNSFSGVAVIPSCTFSMLVSMVVPERPIPNRNAICGKEESGTGWVVCFSIKELFYGSRSCIETCNASEIFKRLHYQVTFSSFYPVPFQSVISTKPGISPLY